MWDRNRYTSKIKTFIEIGKLLVPLSTCKRAQSGTIIFPVDCSAIYSLGYNGPSQGLPNDSCTGKEGKCGCVHAEANAIAKFNNSLARPSIMYSTRMPCLNCAGLILNCSSIIGLIWTDEYRNLDGWNLLKRANLKVFNEVDLYSTTVQIILKCWKES